MIAERERKKGRESMNVREPLYETKISDERWWAYDIPGNAGWIAYLACLFHSLKRGMNAFNMAALLPGGLILLGVGELISERIAGLDRALKKGGSFCGCFYIRGGCKRTDWFIRHLYQPKGFFTPPYETETSLRQRLSELYRSVNVTSVEGIGCFRCVK